MALPPRRAKQPILIAVVGDELRPSAYDRCALSGDRRRRAVVEVAFAATSVTIGVDTMALEIVGREEELASVRVFLDRAEEGPTALVLEGEAGIGKSTLWLAGVAHARARGMRVIWSRPAEPERGLADVGLGDLFEEVLDEVLPGLPAPRRRALEVVLLREEAAGDTVDLRALGVATRSTLQLLGENTRLVVAIDDVQWLDDASARTLAFALRRLRDQAIVVLLARRVGSGAPASELEQAIDPERVERLALGPLSVGAVQRLLQARLGRALPRPTLLRLHETSGGNPFYALELARARAADGAAADPTEPLRVPESVDRLLRKRLDGLSPGTREALCLISAGGRLSPATLCAAGVSEDAVAPAYAAHVIEYADGVVRFTHPLLASALYQELVLEERERAHRLLAEVVDDPLARARHLALASSEPDADVAAQVERAATVAASRGASAAAAELAEHTLRLTSGDAGEDRHRRAIEAARMHLLAGDPHRAHAFAQEILAASAKGRERAEALIVLSDIEALGAPERAVALRREALDEAASHPALQASIHRWLGDHVRVSEGLGAAELHARASLELAERLGEDGLRAAALALLGVLRFNAGEPDAHGFAEQGFRLAGAVDEPRTRLEAAFGLIHILTWTPQIDRARTLLEELYQELSEHDELASASVLWFLSLVELAAGRLAVAADHADRQRELYRLYAIDYQENPLAIWVVARIAAHRGELDRARELAERSRAFATGQPQVVAGQEGVLGLAAAWSDKPLDAVARFAAAEEARYGTGVRAPSTYWWRAEYVEALLELDRIDAAVALLDVWEADATRLGLDWVLAHVVRCRGFVAAGRGDVEAALALFAQAADRHEAVGDPFGRARALLALGIVRRRARQKRPAREAIEAAVAAFETIGAAGWAAKARGELGRIGGRTRSEGLTPAERRVAVLVAEGRTNREVAAALLLAERTVETHLSHVYAKLGVRSRAELARAYRPGSEAAEQSSGGLTISS
jgi:DNA-binding CsgD family transcriptional regulator